jgi:hypothetical protein
MTLALKIKFCIVLLFFSITLQGILGIIPHNYIPVTATSSNTSIIENQVSLKDFSAALKSKTSSELKGIYINEVLALRVVRQPSGQPGFVSSVEGVVTQFSLAQKYNVVGLLAHNFSSGSLFFGIKLGDNINLIFGDGTIKELQVTKVEKYQALSPSSPYSEFINLSTGERLSAEKMFYKYYTGDPHVILQTCIQKDGISSWGRLFVIAETIP